MLMQPEDPYIRVRGATSIGGRRLNADTLYVARQSGGAIVVTTSGGRRVARVANGATVPRPGGAAPDGAGAELHRRRPLSRRDRDPHRGRRGDRDQRAGHRHVCARGGGRARCRARGRSRRSRPRRWRPAPTRSRPASPPASSTSTRTPARRCTAASRARACAATPPSPRRPGAILTYGGVPAVTYYFSTSGGHTENVEYSFVGSLAKPWLVGVPDPYDTQLALPPMEGAHDTPRGLTPALVAPGRFKRVKVLDRGVSPRVVRARVIGSAGSTVLTGPADPRPPRPPRHLVHVRPGEYQRGRPALARAPAS